MKNANKLYFNDLSGLGDLYIRSEYIYFEEPILFLCTNKRLQLFLCLCAEFRHEYRWIISEVEKRILLKMIRNEISIYEAIQKDRNLKYIVCWKQKMIKEELREVQFEQISKLDLPEQDVFLDASIEEQEKYVKELNEIYSRWGNKYFRQMEHIQKKKMVLSAEEIFSVWKECFGKRNLENVWMEELKCYDTEENDGASAWKGYLGEKKMKTIWMNRLEYHDGLTREIKKVICLEKGQRNNSPQNMNFQYGKFEPIYLQDDNKKINAFSIRGERHAS